jgi:NADH-quinone oxidoreductase subunit E
MLTDEERREIQKEIEGREHKRGVSIDALKIIQKHRGWISDEIKGVAEMLEMSVDDLDNVATFYNLIFKEPVGKHVILICDSISCWVTGYEEILERLTSRLGAALGETTKDGQYTLLPVACLGVCDSAPAMMVDDELYTRLTPELVDEILEKYR